MHCQGITPMTLALPAPCFPTKPNLIFLFILLHLFIIAILAWTTQVLTWGNFSWCLNKGLELSTQLADLRSVLTSSKALSVRLYCVFSLSAVLYLSCHLNLNQGWKARVRVGNIPIHLSLSPSQSKGCLAEGCGNSCLLISIATLTW